MHGLILEFKYRKDWRKHYLTLFSLSKWRWLLCLPTWLRTVSLLALFSVPDATWFKFRSEIRFPRNSISVWEGWTDQQTDGWTQRWIDWQTGRQKDGWTERYKSNPIISCLSTVYSAFPPHRIPSPMSKIGAFFENLYPELYRFADIDIGIYIYRYWFANDVIAHKIILIGGKMENHSFWSIWDFSMVFFSLTTSPWVPEHCMVF